MNDAASSKTHSRAARVRHTRRAFAKAAAWAAPVAITVTATPAFAISQRTLVLVSNFGVGWYPERLGSTSSGRLQVDAADIPGQPKWFRVDGTEPGDVISNIRLEILLDWGTDLVFHQADGGDSRWPAPVYERTDVINGVSYRVYVSEFNGEVAGSQGSTDIPRGFYFYASTRYYSNRTIGIKRLATVTNPQNTAVTHNLEAGGGTVNVANTNVTDYPKP